MFSDWLIRPLLTLPQVPEAPSREQKAKGFFAKTRAQEAATNLSMGQE